MTDTFDEVRIIASDASRLNAADRAILKTAADELEQRTRELLACQKSLTEANDHRIALNERLLEIKRAEVAALPKKEKPLITATWGQWRFA